MDQYCISRIDFIPLVLCVSSISCVDYKEGTHAHFVEGTVAYLNTLGERMRVEFESDDVELGC